MHSQDTIISEDLFQRAKDFSIKFNLKKIGISLLWMVGLLVSRSLGIWVILNTDMAHRDDVGQIGRLIVEFALGAILMIIIGGVLAMIAVGLKSWWEWIQNKNERNTL